MRGRQSRAQLLHNLDTLVAGQTSDSAQQNLEILTVDIFHRQKVQPFEFADVVHATDIGMTDLTGQPDFGVKVRQVGSDLLPVLSAET